MSLRVIGAGLGRTGTYSLKLALERLLGAPCYHMAEVFQHPEHIHTWLQAARGEPVDWEAFFQGFAAEVDWPACAYWRELSERYPDAPVLLSTRDPESWWASAISTIFPSIDHMRRRSEEWHEMVRTMMARTFVPDLSDRDVCIAAFQRHNEEVRSTIPADRLFEWRPGDGWEPLCRMLRVPVPDEPYPHENTREEFQQRIREAVAAEQQGQQPQH